VVPVVNLNQTRVYGFNPTALTEALGWTVTDDLADGESYEVRIEHSMDGVAWTSAVVWLVEDAMPDPPPKGDTPGRSGLVEYANANGSVLLADDGRQWRVVLDPIVGSPRLDVNMTQRDRGG